VLVSQIRKWPPLVISLQMFLLYRSAEDARGWVQSSTGYGAAVCALRRLHRYNRYRAHLIDVLGPDVDDDTVIEYANADARRTYANPVKSAILLERDEILKSQAMFGDSMEITDRVVSIALDVDDADVLVHSSESAEFLVGLLRVVHEQAGLEVAKVFGYRMSIDLGLEEAGHLRPMREVATLSGLSAAVCRAHLDVATKVAGDFLHSSERSAMPV
jgi:hypothetical protein